MKVIPVLAATLLLLVGGHAALAQDNGPGGGGGGCNYDCDSCHIHAWGPTSWAECVHTPNGSAGGCYVDRGTCKFIYGGCSSLPDDPVYTRGIAL